MGKTNRLLESNEEQIMDTIKILEELKSQMIDDVMDGKIDTVSGFANYQLGRIDEIIDKLHAEIGGENNDI